MRKYGDPLELYFIFCHRKIYLEVTASEKQGRLLMLAKLDQIQSLN